jgi:hypothetical protein
MYRISGLVCEDLDEIRPGEISGRLNGVIIELLNAVLDTEFLLRPGVCAVDTRGGLSGVASHEVWSLS